EVTIENLQGNVSSALLAEQGTNTVSQVGIDLTRDSRDNVFSPTKGFIVNGGIDLAGGLFGADKDFYRIQGSGSYYVPLKWNSVLEVRLRAGIVDDYGDSIRVPIFERFFAGGASTVRGYDERDVGPKDPATADSIGGESLIVGNLEYTIPLIEFIKLAGFVDAGSVSAEADEIGEDSFKVGTGLGLRVKTPIGPVKLDYGYPLKEPDDGKREGKFYFSVSRGF
ncbi:MAG: outer membrane protein assembly factor, partial [Candidatus Omnitrophica bacterium]|nr:outer membrane protein assembly factor [Candidatus Omnitrophota bacterium]